MSKKKILIQASHVIYDASGQPMSPGFVYSVTDDEIIDGYIKQGFASLETSVSESEVKEEPKKPVINKNSKTQETESTLTPQENN
jgi:hypothetical protein